MTGRVGKKMLLALLFFASGAVYSGEADEQAMRDEAHRTVMRRLSVSGKARTADSGISKAAAGFVDLFFDLERNRNAIGNRQRTGHHHQAGVMTMGVPHPRVLVQDGRLRFDVCFGNLLIDRVELPLDEVPMLVERALADGFSAAVELDGEDRVFVDAVRGRMLSLLFAQCDGPLSGADGERVRWLDLREKLAAYFIREFEAAPLDKMTGALGTLGQLGGDTAAAAIVRRVRDLPSGTPPYVAGMLTRTLAGMKGATAAEYVIAILDGTDDALKAQAVGGIGAETDRSVLKRWEKILLDQRTAGTIRICAIQGGENAQTPRCREVLAEVFLRAEDDDVKYAAACAVTRLGSRAAVPYLREKMEAMQKTGQQPGVVSYIQSLLKQVDGESAGGD